MPTLNHIRLRWASLGALSKLAFFAVLSGLLSGAVILLFRWVVESSQHLFLPNDPNVPHSEYYEAIAWYWRLVIPTLGGVLIGLIFHKVHASRRAVGIGHVIERLTHHQGHLPISNAVLQFVGGAISLISGHSVGREGPNVHLGASASGWVASRFHLTLEQQRVLIGCGAAAAIAASFNTPLAGVIFAMEVILMAYSVIGFIPIILASVTGAVLTRAFYGHAPVFVIPSLELNSLYEIPFLVCVGIIIGCFAAFFCAAIRIISKHSQQTSYITRCTTAGFLTGVIALWMPTVMGISYDTVNAALIGTLSVSFMLNLVIFKLLASSFCVGLGLPGGLIGPALVIGAALGGSLGIIGQWVFPTLGSDPGFYALLGMTAMMGATLQAPLAALIAILELASNPNMILPGMLVVVTSCLVSSQMFKQDSIFLSLLKDQGLLGPVDKSTEQGINR